MNFYRKLLSKLSVLTIFVLLFSLWEPSSTLEKHQTVHAAGGVAQLTIITQTPVVRVLVSGINQRNDVAEWDQGFSSRQLKTTITTTDWWWRFQWWFYPSLDTGPYVWVWYADGTRDNKPCSNSNIEWISPNEVTCTFPLPPSLPVAPDFSQSSRGQGISLYGRGNEYIQRISLGLGASVELLHGGVVPGTNRLGYYGGNDPKFNRQSLATAWTDFSRDNNNEFCVTNGQFFSPGEDPTRLAFFLKKDGEVITDGYNIDGTTGLEEYPGKRIMLEIWEDRANMTLLPAGRAAAGQMLRDSNAPNIIVGLTEAADKGVNVDDSRTFVGVVDYNNDSIFETILIFNSPSATQPEAAAALRSFGAVGRNDEVKVMMLDGGGSTQLICKGQQYPLVPSTDGGEGRLLPQTIGTNSSNFSGEGDFYFLDFYHIFPGETINFITPVPPMQGVATFSTLWPGSDVVMTLVSPTGRIIDRATVDADVVHDVGTTFETYTIINPEAGNWQVGLYGADVAPEGEDVEFTFITGNAAPSPQLAYVNGDTLILNMGSAERRAARSINADEINEEFQVLQLDIDKFAVTAFGLTQVFQGAIRIQGDGDDGNDIVKLDAGEVPFTAPADIKGGIGDDLIQSGEGVDTLSGGDGNDVINSGGGNDIVSGDSGNDELNGEGGEDAINGGAGNDTISGGTEADVLHGDDGDDNIRGEDGADEIYGDSGGDSLFGGVGDDSINGGPDNDLMEGNDGADSMHGDDGNDQMYGQADADAMFGDAGDDVMDGGAGADLMEGNDAADTMHGGTENDKLYGNAGPDKIYGDAGQDTILGHTGNDELHGGADDDYMEGNEDADTMLGDEGQDDMLGGSPLSNTLDGPDTMSGGLGHDVLIGDNGTITRPGGLNPYNNSVMRNVVLFDVQVAATSINTNIAGNDIMNGDEGDDLIFGQGGDDTISGGLGSDYQEGNAGSDIVSGDAGPDDIIGGSSANDGVIDADRRGDGLADTGDELHGGDQGDVMAGDNARILRPLDSDNQWLIDPNTGEPVRQVVLFDIETVETSLINLLTSGPDRMFGGAGVDEMFGQGNGPSSDIAGSDPVDGVDNDRNGREAGGADGAFDCLDGRDNDNDGLTDTADPQCATMIDNNAGGDEMHGGAGHDYMEGNTGSDWMFGDQDEDDIIGGSSAGDGVIGGSVMPTNLKDGHDVINGNDDDDVLVGDNAQVLRPVDSSGLYKRLVGGVFDLAIRDARMSSRAELAGAFGNDWMSGGTGTDDLYGQLGNDYIEGNAGEDAMVGDLGKITNNLIGVNDGIADPGTQQLIAPQAPFFDRGELIYQNGSLYRQVELYFFLSGQGGGGDDTLYGGEDNDALHGGAGKDILNGNIGDDRLFGGDNSDAMWGGNGHDILFGGYGEDYLDILPRSSQVIRKIQFPNDPPTWFEATRLDSYQGLDIMYGGWDRDWMQADVSAPGRNNGDRMIDWAGAFNAYYRCDAAYGEWSITRQHSPSVVEFLQKLAQGFGAVSTNISGTSGFQETAIVFPAEIRFNSNPPNTDNPAHFVCGPYR